MMPKFDPNILIALIGCILGSGGVLQFMLQRYDKRMEVQRAERQQKREDNDTRLQLIGDLTCANAQDRIVYLADQYVERGSITIREKSMLEDMFKPYESLGWNHWAKTAMEEVRKLPVKNK